VYYKLYGIRLAVETWLRLKGIRLIFVKETVLARARPLYGFLARDFMKEEALRWIVCGGLAANFYGSKRPLQDIDLFVPASHFWEVVEAGIDYISKPAQYYCEEAEGWDLEYVQFLHSGVKVEVGSSKGTRIYNPKNSCWETLEIDFKNTIQDRIFGIEVSVMPITDLINYKSVLGRPVDFEDIAAVR